LTVARPGRVVTTLSPKYAATRVARGKAMTGGRWARLLSRAVLVVAAGWLVAGAAAVSPAAAAAAQQAPVTGTHATVDHSIGVQYHLTNTTAVSPAQSICPLYGGYVYFYFSGCTYDSRIKCVSSLQGFINGYPGLYPRYVSNGCNWRVWIYSGVNRTVNNLCVNPRTADHYIHRNHIWFWISASPGR
jgi:hypothetical protein